MTNQEPNRKSNIHLILDAEKYFLVRPPEDTIEINEYHALKLARWFPEETQIEEKAGTKKAGTGKSGTLYITVKHKETT